MVLEKLVLNWVFLPKKLIITILKKFIWICNEDVPSKLQNLKVTLMAFANM